MFRFGLPPTVLLAAILTFLALSTGHDASATPIFQDGQWASVFSTSGQVNAGDCQGGISGTDNNLTSGSDPWTCFDANGVVTLSNADLTAMVTGPPNTIVGTLATGTFGFTGTVSVDGTESTGTWTGGIGPGTYGAALQQPSSGGTVTFPNAGPGGASLTGANGQTAIISAPSGGGPLPPQFSLLGEKYYHVVTTDPGTPGPYIFCANYSELSGTTPSDIDDKVGSLGSVPVLETDLKIAHLESGSFVDLDRHSPGTDPSANIVCAQTASLSEFALVAPTPIPVGGLVSVISGDSSSGISIWLWVVAIASFATLLVTGGAWIGKQRRRRWGTD